MLRTCFLRWDARPRDRGLARTVRTDVGTPSRRVVVTTLIHAVVERPLTHLNCELRHTAPTSAANSIVRLATIVGVADLSPDGDHDRPGFGQHGKERGRSRSPHTNAAGCGVACVTMDCGRWPARCLDDAYASALQRRVGVGYLVEPEVADTSPCLQRDGRSELLGPGAGRCVQIRCLPGTFLPDRVTVMRRGHLFYVGGARAFSCGDSPPRGAAPERGESQKSGVLV